MVVFVLFMALFAGSGCGEDAPELFLNQTHFDISSGDKTVLVTLVDASLSETFAPQVQVAGDDLQWSAGTGQETLVWNGVNAYTGCFTIGTDTAAEADYQFGPANPVLRVSYGAVEVSATMQYAPVFDD
jgi:hypothetical protein